jgi:uncharacterized membrane protein
MSKIEKLKKSLGFLIFILGIGLFDFLIFITPILAMLGFEEIANGLYFGFSFTCHQLNSRSICLFQDQTISDCTYYKNTIDYTKTNEVIKDEKIGYKFPVCSRDIGIYFSMLLGGIAFGLLNRKNLGTKKVPPLIFLILAMIPIGIDGTGQLLGLWESSNFIRLVSGFIIGFVSSFYAIPILNHLSISDK